MYDRDTMGAGKYHHGNENWHGVSRGGGLRKQEPMDLKHNFNHEHFALEHFICNF